MGNPLGFAEILACASNCPKHALLAFGLRRRAISRKTKHFMLTSFDALVSMAPAGCPPTGMKFQISALAIMAGRSPFRGLPARRQRLFVRAYPLSYGLEKVHIEAFADFFRARFEFKDMLLIAPGCSLRPEKAIPRAPKELSRHISICPQPSLGWFRLLGHPLAAVISSN
jgi:hypothetical protein